MTDNRSDSPTSTQPRSGGRLSDVRTRVGEGYSSARLRASDAYSTTRQTAAQGFDDNPLIVLAGGLAIGAIAGALLPRTRKEEELLGNVGRQINETAKDAIRAAREAGSEQLGLSKDAAKSQVQSLLDKATKAATTAGEAAADTVRSRSKR